MFFVDGKIVEGELELVVRDNGKWRAPRDGFGGRGLVIARAITPDVTVEPSTGGTTVTIRTPFKRDSRA
jgi:hypothetical protein